MALSIAKNEIYAGRYHTQTITRPDFLKETKQANTAEYIKMKDAVCVDTVTFSDEGLAKSKNWREFAQDNPNFSSMNVTEQLEELNRQMHTTNAGLDPTSLFQCELGDVANEISQGERSQSHEDFLKVIGKAYQTIYDRIEEEFSDPNRETTWIQNEDGTYREETKEDRIGFLNQAYESRAEFSASAAKTMLEIENVFGGKNYSKDFIEETAEKVKESWQNTISEKNLERLRAKVDSVKDYVLDFGISADWSSFIDSLLYKQR